MSLWFEESLESELFSSWLIRTAIAHGCTPLTLTYWLWGKHWRPWTRDLDRISSQKHFNVFIPYGLSIETLSSLTLKKEAKILSQHTTKTWLTQLGVRGSDRTGGLRFCPICLYEKPFIKKDWRLVWNTVCDLHGMLLQTACQKCSMPFMPHKIAYDLLDIRHCTRCRSDLTQQITLSSINEIVDLQNYFNTTIYTEMGSTINGPLRENLEKYHFFMSFLNRSTTIQSRSDRKLFKILELDLSKKSGLTEDLAKMSPDWLFELMKIVLLIEKKSSQQLALDFIALGYTEQSFTSRVMPYHHKFIVDFLTQLPSKPRVFRKVLSRQHNSNPIPLKKSKVIEKWHNLQMKMT